MAIGAAPRPCGDEPLAPAPTATPLSCSPPTRGSAHQKRGGDTDYFLIPAPCGDDPRISSQVCQSTSCPAHAGMNPSTQEVRGKRFLRPAHAGMNRHCRHGEVVATAIPAPAGIAFRTPSPQSNDHLEVWIRWRWTGG